MCMFWDPMGLSNKLSCEAGSFSHHHNPHRFFQLEILRFYFHVLEPCHMVYLAPQLFLPVYLHVHVGLPTPPAAALLKYSLPWLPISTPSTCLDECFFFNSLVLGLPYSSIFWQFWLFLFLNLLLSFFWLCEEAQCVYLHLHLG